MRQRTPLTEIGEMRISLADKYFFFKPSFAAMNELGSPKEIVELYATLNGYEYAAILGAIQSMPWRADSGGKNPVTSCLWQESAQRRLPHHAVLLR